MRGAGEHSPRPRVLGRAVLGCSILVVAVLAPPAGSAAARGGVHDAVPDSRTAAVAPPAPTRWVTDNAQFLAPKVRDAVNSKLRKYQARTGHQVVVWIGRSTLGEPIEAFATRAFNAWGVGRKGINDGLVIFLFSTDQTIRIEVGSGFEARVPNATAAHIIQEVMAPRLRAGDHNGAIVQGVNATLRIIDGAPWSTVARELGALESPSRH